MEGFASSGAAIEGRVTCCGSEKVRRQVNNDLSGFAGDVDRAWAFRLRCFMGQRALAKAISQALPATTQPSCLRQRGVLR
jgi:hypothetical protein